MNETLTMLNANGGTAGQFFWIPKDTTDWANETYSYSPKMEPGWYDVEEANNWVLAMEEGPIVSKNSTPLPAGQGFMIEVFNEGAAVQFPAAYEK